jgi:hypothetical protein
MQRRRSREQNTAHTQMMERATRLPTALHRNTARLLRVAFCTGRLADVRQVLHRRHRRPCPITRLVLPHCHAPGSPQARWLAEAPERNNAIPILLRIERLLTPRVKPGLP